MTRNLKFILNSQTKPQCECSFRRGQTLCHNQPSENMNPDLPSTTVSADPVHPDTPKRSYMDDPKIEWRTSKPNYDLVNKKYLNERTRKHPVDSTEKFVENLVKTWEMESTHKTNPKDWGTVNHDRYKFSTNGGKFRDLVYNIVNGNYNMMMETSPLFDVSKETNESSHSLFKSTFPDGFAWELLELHSGPPKVSFTWRHWAHWTGPYRDNLPTGELMELIGSAVAEVDEDLKIVDLQVFFDPHPMLARLMIKQDAAKPLDDGRPRCPFQH